jgi:HK97 gp10 family phage protein
MSGITIEISGAKEIEQFLEELVPRQAANILRATVHGIAAEIGKEARKSAPVESGRLKRSSKWRRRRALNPMKPASEVYFMSRAYYWRFVEHGTQGKQARAARPFFNPAVQRIASDIDAVTNRSFTRVIQRRLRAELKKQAQGRKK